MKKALSFVLTIAMLVILAVPALASSGKVSELRLEQYYADMPNIDVWFYPVDADGVGVRDFDFSPEDVEANLDGHTLKVLSVESAESKPMVYVVLLDVSTSIGVDFFANIKNTLLNWARGLREQDKLILIPMGDQISTLLEGNESREEAIAAIEGLEQQTRAQTTKYYEALNKAVDKAERLAGGTRCALITVSDGLNSASSVYSSAGTLERMRSAKLPMYTIGVGRKDNEAARQELASFTERTNGTYFDLSNSAKNDPEKVDEVFGRVIDTLGACRLVRLAAPSNSLTGSTLRLKINTDDGSPTLTVKEFRIDSWQSDTTPPEIISVIAETPLSLKVAFSEAVVGADKTANYVVTDSEGVPIAIENATYDSSDNTATIKLQDELFNGSYKLSCVNITDDSIEKNPVKIDADALPELEITGNPRPIEPQANWFRSFGWIILLALVMLGLLIVILIILANQKKKKDAEQQGSDNTPGAVINGVPGSSVGGAKVDLSAVDGRNIELTVIEKNGISRTVNMFVADSCIIGRSSASSDLSIEDPRMSRQHCVLCYSNGDILINDLGSSNGTSVNGIPVNGYRKVFPNDSIEIGNTRIVVRSC